MMEKKRGTWRPSDAETPESRVETRPGGQVGTQQPLCQEDTWRQREPSSVGPEREEHRKLPRLCHRAGAHEQKPLEIL